MNNMNRGIKSNKFFFFKVHCWGQFAALSYGKYNVCEVEG